VKALRREHQTKGGGRSANPGSGEAPTAGGRRRKKKEFTRELAELDIAKNNAGQIRKRQNTWSQNWAKERRQKEGGAGGGKRRRITAYNFWPDYGQNVHSPVENRECRRKISRFFGGCRCKT